jgi:hypothetical protein
MWTTGAAIVMCLALGGVPALAQERVADGEDDPPAPSQ